MALLARVRCRATASRFCNGLSVPLTRAKCILLVVQAHSTCNAIREELGKQLVENRKERKRSVVRAVPCVAFFRDVDHRSLTPHGG